MKIGLINLYSTRNAGDAAIYAALSKILHGHEVLALAEPGRLGHLQGIATAPLHSECDAYISVGGDIFNNARPRLVTRTFLSNLAQLARHSRRTLLFGQSIPASCRGLAFRLLCQVLKSLPSVTVRDKESWQRLRRAGVDAHLSYDLAFSHHPSPVALGEALAVFAGHQLDPARTVLLSLRGFDPMYPHDERRFVATLVNLCRLLREAHMQPALLLQSAAEGDDLALAFAIAEQTPGVPIIGVLHPPPCLAGYELLQGLLALASLAVGVRYHTSVLALAAGRMPYNLYYSNKGRDLCERLGVPGCDVATFDPQQGIGPLLATQYRTYADDLPCRQVETDVLMALNAVPQRRPAQVSP